MPKEKNVTLELKLTQEQAAVAGAILADKSTEVIENAKAAVERIAQALVEVWRSVRAALLKNAAKFIDDLLRTANTNPKWWHLYKHSKKRRVRKKYRDRLMRQLRQKLAAINGETKEAKT